MSWQPVSWVDVDENLDVQIRLEYALKEINRGDLRRAGFYIAGLRDDLMRVEVLVPTGEDR